MKSKHSNSSRLTKILTIMFFLILIICVIFFFMKRNKKEDNKTLSNTTQSKTSSVETIEQINIPDKVGDYDVLGKIVLDKIKIEQYILDTNDDAALELGTTKFYGPNLNEPGNFCIAGHNYDEIFGFLPYIEIDDTFYIIDKAKSKKVTYKVYDKYKVYPDNLDCLNQDTNDKREVTLITCTPGNLTRLIIKAKEI